MKREVRLGRRGRLFSLQGMASGKLQQITLLGKAKGEKKKATGKLKKESNREDSGGNRKERK